MGALRSSEETRRIILDIVNDSIKAADRAALCVAGFVYFEACLPQFTSPPVPGTEEFFDTISLSLGGAFTTAAAAEALGAAVVLAYPLGTGLADAAIREFVNRHEIAQEPWTGRDNPAVSIVFSSPEDRSFFSAADFDSLRCCPELPAASWIHVVGLKEALALDSQLAAARRSGAKISVTASWAPQELRGLAASSDKPWDLLLLNRAEAEEACGSVEEALGELSGAAPDIIVTLAESGARAVIDGSEYRVPAEPARVVDPTGAGDAFSAGYLAGMIEGRTPEESLRLGSRAASRIVQHNGTIGGNAALVEELRRLE